MNAPTCFGRLVRTIAIAENLHPNSEPYERAGWAVMALVSRLAYVDGPAERLTPRRLARALYDTTFCFIEEDRPEDHERARVRALIVGELSNKQRHAFFVGVSEYPETLAGLQAGQHEILLTVLSLYLHDADAVHDAREVLSRGPADLHADIAALPYEERLAVDVTTGEGLPVGRAYELGSTKRELGTLRKRGLYRLAQTWGLLPASAGELLPAVAA